MSEQKFKLSDDQNTLVVENGQLAGEYATKKQDGCTGCVFLENNTNCKIGTVHTCVYSNRKDEQSIVWQKVKPKQDDKKAVAIFSDNETVLKISGHGEHDGTYEAKQGLNCDNCFFGKGEDKNKCDYNREILGSSRCNSVSRKDTVSIFWIKKENTEMTEAPAPAPAPAPALALQHRHFDLIVAWAKNPTQPVWFWNVDEWEKAANPIWHMEHYVIGEKPTEPPVKMVKYDGGSIEFPEPARVELERDTHYWAVTIYGADHDYWTGHSSDFELLDNGLIQLTKEDAEKQSEALVELLKNHAQKWG